MATIDPVRDELVMRVVYDGPPMAGKTTSLLALAGRLGGKVVAPREIAGRTLYFDWLDYTGGLFEGRRIRCQIVSVPGQATLATRRAHLLRRADVVVFVADALRAGLNASGSYLKGLQSVLGTVPGPPIGIVVQANKRDQAHAATLAEVREALQTEQLGAALIETVATDGSGVREAFVFAVRLALDRVREQLRLGQLDHKAPSVDNPADLLAELQESEGGALKLAADDGLAHTTLHSLQTEPDATPPSPPVSGRPLPAAAAALPRPPDSQVPTGFVWPPVSGRIMLLDAQPERAPLSRTADGHLEGFSPTGWRVHTFGGAVHGSLDAARGALMTWARLHASLYGALSSERCVALAADGAGYRLWQIVRTQANLDEDFARTVREGPKPAARWLQDVARHCLREAAGWSDGTGALPIRLTSLARSPEGLRYIDLMPLTLEAPRGDTSPNGVLRRIAAELRSALVAASALTPDQRQAFEGCVRWIDALVETYASEAVGRLAGAGT